MSVNSIYGEELEPVINGTESDSEIYMDKSGEALVTAYKIFVGITLAYYNVKALKELHRKIKGDMLELTYCIEGAVGHESGGSLAYLSSGDLLIQSMGDGAEKRLDFPVCRYRGISVLIDTNKSPDSLTCILPDVNVSLPEIIDKYCSGGRSSIIRSSPELSRIFADPCPLPEPIKKGWLKVKFLELLMCVSALEKGGADIFRSSASANQIRLAGEITDYIKVRMDERITVSQLSEEFHISASQIKGIFRSIYGMSVHAYIRAQKMQAAALLLCTSDISVLEASVQFGYSNASKFSNAFKVVMGVLPKDYRKSGR